MQQNIKQDTEIPEVTNISFAVTRQVLVCIIMLVVLTVGITLIVTHTYILGAAISAFAIYVLVDSIRYITNRTPQITLSNKGIMTSSTPFYSWAEIDGEVVGEEQVDKNMTIYYLAYNFPGGDEKIYLYGLRTTHRHLAKLLKVYRNRSMGIE